MAETNNILEKVDDIMAVDSKTVPESSGKGENSINNAHDEVDKGGKQNGEEMYGQNDQKEPVIEETKANEDSKEEQSETAESAKPMETVDSEPAEKQDSNSHADTVIATDTATSATVENDVKQAEEPKIIEKPAARGRGAPKGKRAPAGRRGATEPASDVAANAPNDKADEEKKVSEAAEDTKEKSPDVEAEPKVSQKGGRKRGANTKTEAPAVKVPKSTKEAEGESSGIEEGSTEEKKMPLLETPLVIEGKRQRQKVDRLDSKMLAAPQHVKDAADVPQGSGVKLGDIAYIEAMITKTMTDDLKPLHRVCFGRAGQNYEIRKHLRSFCGFDFEKGNDSYNRKLKQVENWSMKQLKKICEVLGLERGGKKDDLQNAMLDFLLKPVDTGKKLPQSKKRKSSSVGTKKSRSGTRVRNRSADSDHAASSESGDDEDAAVKGGSSGEEPKAKRAKKSPQKKETASSSKKPSRGKGAAKAAKKTTPTDDALRTTIKDLLQGANLEEITMRDMCRKVYAKYPDFDLTSRKDFIKDAVKAIISSSAE